MHAPPTRDVAMIDPETQEAGFEKYAARPYRF